MALVGAGVQVIPLLGAAVFLPSTLATALRLHTSPDPGVGNDKDPLDEFLASFISARDEPGVAFEIPIELRKQLGSDGVLSRTDDDGDFSEDNSDGDGEDSFKEYDARTRKNGLTFNNDGSTEAPSQRPVASLDTWSVVWYCGMFAAFTSLFLIMPCSQVLCKAGLAAARRDPRLRPRPPLLPPSATMHYGTPPPPYKQFAPPPYESLFVDPRDAGKPPFEKKGVYIIPLRDDSEGRLIDGRVTGHAEVDLDAPPPPYSATEVSSAPGESVLVTAAVAVAVTTASSPSGMSPSVA